MCELQYKLVFSLVCRSETYFGLVQDSFGSVQGCFKVASAWFGLVQDSFGSVQGCFSLVRFGSRFLRFGSRLLQFGSVWFKIPSVRFKVASTVQGHVGGWFGSFGFILVQGCFTSNTHVGAVQGR
jgi:hypothetical protein